MQNWNFSDDEWDAPVVVKLGHDELILAREDPNEVRRLLEAGHPITPNAILGACYTGCEETLEILLAASTNPNVRLEGADDKHDAVLDDWADHDVAPRFGRDTREWYPLQYANFGPMAVGFEGDTASSTRTTQVVLRHRPDLFAVFKQPLRQSYPFPCTKPKEEEDGGEGDDNDDQLSDPEDYSDSWSIVDGGWRKQPYPADGYGLRSLLHSLFEDGANLSPFLDAGFDIDLERRDPLGRTLLHAACRSGIGADALPSVPINVIHMQPLPDSNAITAPPGSETSIFHSLRKRGADLLAVDASGKNILHHLLEARTPSWNSYPDRPPLILNTLRYILRTLPQLTNQPDRHRTYPLHAALQRLQGHVRASVFTLDSPLEQVVHELLDAGADGTVSDGRGNTALHYLVERGLAERTQRAETRALCRRVCELGIGGRGGDAGGSEATGIVGGRQGIDVNARNTCGFTALEMLLGDDGELGRLLFTLNYPDKSVSLPGEDIDAEIFAMLDAAGAEWDSRDTQGRTLLHHAAMHETDRTAWRLKYLLGRGLDSGLKDKEGKTAADIAKETSNNAALTALR